MSIILEAKKLQKSFGAVTAAANINVRIESDSVVGLIGSNGAGKTTFLNMVTGYLKPTSGTIYFDGRELIVDINGVHTAADFQGYLSDEDFARLEAEAEAEAEEGDG